MGSTELQEDYVFLTKNHDHASTDTIWLVKEYDPIDYFVHFYKVEPEDKIGAIGVNCTRLNKTHTKVQVLYEYIALSDTGNQFIEEFTSSGYKEFISGFTKGS